MRKLVVIDLESADIALFEAYERTVVPLLGEYGGRMELCVRSVDGTTETHILHFPDVPSFEGFLSDPVRTGLRDAWQRTGAATTITDVNEVDYCVRGGPARDSTG